MQLPVRRAIWIRRHPLDVFLSYRHYLLLDQSQIADVNLRSPSPFADSYVRRRRRLSEGEDMSLLLACFITYGTLAPGFVAAGSWFEHTANWLEYSRIRPCLPLQYERLVADPVGSLSTFATEMGFSRGDLEAAVLLAQDDTKPDGSFFWRQTPHHYRDVLPKELIKKWYRIYSSEMRTFGY